MLSPKPPDRSPGQSSVELAMRYGQPSIEQGLAALLQEDIDDLLLVPLFPHYAMSTTLSAGGGSFTLVPALNDQPQWVEALGGMLLNTLQARQL